MSKALKFTISVLCIAALTACVTPVFNGQPVIHRETIKISTGVARLVTESVEPVLLEEDKRIKCTRTLITGSQFPFTYCQTSEEYEDAIHYGHEILRNEQGAGTR